ncbi:MAG TPA: biotin--[acetyl-CoA-carboxylase] ligase [Pyrinomonadaceae bacterium]|nr:biotin--[acetyl-CoA-carboxylase] ligase [Pyrinomonadaceae bacterium]
MPRLKIKTLHYESLPSTNTEVARLATEGAAEGLALVADEQTAGRGRLQRIWSSPRGAGLYFSILLRPAMPLNLWPLITFMAALATGDALVDAVGLQTEIKWPNDLLAGERKICGILSETVDTPVGRSVVVGIGINLTARSYPPDLTGVATSVEEETKRPADRDLLLTSLKTAIANWYEQLLGADGQVKILQAWIARSSYANGRLVDVVNGDETFRGITRGVELDGALRVETEANEIRTVRAGDVVNVRSAN